MAGRRLQPNPAQVQPITEIIDPALAQPLQPAINPGQPGMNPGTGPNVGTQPMMHPEMIRAQQAAAEAAQGIPQFQQASEPFLKLHDDDTPAYEDQGDGSQGEPEAEEVVELTNDERMELSSLFTVGRRTEIIDVYGHPVCIESLSVADDLRIGLYRRDFIDAPPADSRSYQIGVCAAGIRTVDGVPLYTPITAEEGAEEVFAKKIAKVRELYPPVVSDIYQAILLLDEKHAALREKLKKQKG